MILNSTISSSYLFEVHHKIKTTLSGLIILHELHEDLRKESYKNYFYLSQKWN